MALDAGTRLGPYEILSPIGKGGMGEVYRARDTKLDRDVAIKVLPEKFASDPERLARFEREAKLLASLNHPNIASIFGFEESDGVNALVLELVEGPTLAERIEQGPIPVDEAITIAKQIAEALEAGHEAGVVHRDLKPANIKLKEDGTVKVLDYGLAKALEGDAPSGTDLALSQSPTLIRQGTQLGVILGTAAYMSPEQAKGKRVDRRTDIFAFGAVLYEMLTGEKAFRGDDVSEVLAAVLKDEPDWERLPVGAPQRVIRRCLAKPVTGRFQHIGDARFELEQPELTVVPATEDRWKRLGLVFLATTLIASAVAGWLAVREEPRPITRASILLPAAHMRTGLEGRGLALSPTGRHVAYVANDQLYVRALDELDARPLAATEGSQPLSPVFSPDGQWIAFLSARDDTLEKVPVSGGASVTLARLGVDVNQLYGGASWGEDQIVFGQAGRGIMRVPGAGGAPEVLVRIDPSPPNAQQPQILPGGEAVLFALGSYALGGWDIAQIVVEELATGKRTVLVEGGRDARYVPTGHLVFMRGDTLFAVPFDVDRLALAGSPITLVEGISTADWSGLSNADISQSGTLAYLPSGMGGPSRSLMWVARDGSEEPIATPSRAYVYPRLSPDGKHIALDSRGEEDDIWIENLNSGSSTRLTFTAERDWYPVWTPDGKRVVFTSDLNSEPALYWRAADGSGPAERLSEHSTFAVAFDISPDGTRLVFGDYSDLHVLRLDDERQVEPLIATEFGEFNADISPDGRWLAYQSNETGQSEVWVQPFPDVDSGRWQVTTTGGTRPLWGPDGKELFYLTVDGVMTVAVDTGGGFEAGTPELVVAAAGYRPQANILGRTYDIAPDGDRLLMIKEGASGDGADASTEIVFVQNWFEELQRLVPTP